MQKKEYKLSVVTPFHNVDLNMFKKAYESMLSQTYGFSEIEWVIVVHNTEAAYLETLHSMLDGHENVVLDILNNDKKTPSSPRNRGLELCTGKYVGFLDGDDSYTPHCLTAAVAAMEDTGADVVTFRREYELESQNCLPITERVLWNQRKKQIVMERHEWEVEKMFEGIWGFVSSRLYNLDFLHRNGIIFDEDILLAEDFHFNIQAYGLSKRVCYLPQLIGYHYYINGSSMLQASKKDGATLVRYARGLAKIFAAGQKYGIPMNDFINRITPHLVRFISSTPEITDEELQEIQEILSPFIEKVVPASPSKLISKDEVEQYFKLTKMILEPKSIRQLMLSGSVSDSHYEVLWDILRKNQATDMGEDLDFAGITTVEDYQAKVPISDYEDYEPLIELTTKVGESNIFVADNIVCYALTAGTMGDAKLIPCTEEHLKAYRQVFAGLVDGKKSFLLFESLPKTVPYNDNAYLDSINGAVLRHYLKEPPAEAGEFTSPKELLFPSEVVDTNHPRLLFALADPNVEQIVSPFTWGVLDAFQYLEQKWEVILADMERGQLTNSLPLSKEFRKALDARLTPNPKRAEELRAIFAAGFSQPIATKIWPRLKKVIAAGSGSFEIYTDKMRRYIGDEVSHDDGLYGAAEALVALPLEGDSGRYRLFTENAFFEFLPLNAAEGERPLLMKELEEGRSYEILLTNHAGLYRYRLGDVITVTSMDSDTPTFQYACRSNQAGTFGGIFLTGRDLYQGVKTLEYVLDIDIADFALWPDKDNGCYAILLEPSLYSEKDIHRISTEYAEKLLDDCFRERSRIYGAAISEGRLHPCRIVWNQPETHLLYRDVYRYRKQIAPDQIKPVRFIDSEQKEKFFLKRTVL